jgi:YhcH/YjgK/YiaL family protein
MVIDSLGNLNKYLTKEQFSKVKDFLDKLSPDMEEGYYEIDGENIFAKVMSYNTSLRNDCKIEAHDKYIDIQSTLIGSEGIDVFHREELKEIQPYDNSNDVVFMEDNNAYYVTVNNLPAYFSMLYPNEAHRPQISLNGKCEKVKKFVIKVQV